MQMGWLSARPEEGARWLVLTQPKCPVNPGCEWAFVPHSLSFGVGGTEVGLDQRFWGLPWEGLIPAHSPCPALRPLGRWSLSGLAFPSGACPRPWEMRCPPRTLGAVLGATCLAGGFGAIAQGWDWGPWPWSIAPPRLLASTARVSPCPGVWPHCVPALSRTQSLWGI